MQSALSKRLTYRIMAVVLAMMAVIATVVYYTVRESMLVEAQGRYLNILRKIQGEQRRITTMVDMATQNNAHDIEEDLDNPEKLFDHMERIVNLSNNIACCYLLFEPYYYPDKGRLFMPCARRDTKGIVRVSRIDSTYHSYFSDVMLQEQLKNDSQSWTKPYIESKMFAGNDEPRMLKTVTVPIHNREGRPVALLCSDLSLDEMHAVIMREMEYAHQMYEEGCNQHSYCFSFSYNGIYLNHPDRQRIVNKNFVEEVKETPDTLDDHVLASMMNVSEGSAMINIDGVPSWIYYQNVKQRKMIGAIVVPKEVIFRNGLRLNIIILAVMVIGLLAIYLFCRRQIKEIADPFAMQKANLEHELKIANGIQMAMLPNTLNSPSEAIELYVSLTPARDVGGDLYDYFLSSDRLFFCIGDVSGKGVPAALLMAVARAMFRSEAQHADSAAAIVNAMNSNLCDEYSGGDFVTMFVGILDLTTGHLDYCNAGHERPVVAGLPLEIRPNLPVRALSDWNYEGQQIQLSPGDMLFLYTDGLCEAKNTAGQQLGRQYIYNLANEHRTDTSQQLVKLMEDEVKRHAGEAEQSDDITLLAIRWQPDKITMQASMDGIYLLEPFIASVAHQAGLEGREAKRLRLAVEEAVANVISHGQATTITLNTSVEGNQLVVTLDDDGMPFDPTADSPTDFSVPADQRLPGGLGIMYLHEMSDGLTYHRTDGHNVLKIIKFINK